MHRTENTFTNIHLHMPEKEVKNEGKKIRPEEEKKKCNRIFASQSHPSLHAINIYLYTQKRSLDPIKIQIIIIIKVFRTNIFIFVCIM